MPISNTGEDAEQLQLNCVTDGTWGITVQCLKMFVSLSAMQYKLF